MSAASRLVSTLGAGFNARRDMNAESADKGVRRETAV
jgi:hypothetical protein